MRPDQDRPRIYHEFPEMCNEMCIVGVYLLNAVANP
jgi:hypothetical protein